MSWKFYQKMFKDAPNNLSFKKPMPATIKEMMKYIEEKEKKMQNRMAVQQGKTDEDNTLLDTDDDDKDFETMNELADIDDLSEEEYMMVMIV